MSELTERLQRLCAPENIPTSSEWQQSAADAMWEALEEIEAADAVEDTHEQIMHEMESLLEEAHNLFGFLKPLVGLETKQALDRWSGKAAAFVRATLVRTEG